MKRKFKIFCFLIIVFMMLAVIPYNALAVGDVFDDNFILTEKINSSKHINYDCYEEDNGNQPTRGGPLDCLFGNHSWYLTGSVFQGKEGPTTTYCSRERWTNTYSCAVSLCGAWKSETIYYNHIYHTKVYGPNNREWECSNCHFYYMG